MHEEVQSCSNENCSNSSGKENKVLVSQKGVAEDSSPLGGYAVLIGK